jgi:hypothetical protein
VPEVITQVYLQELDTLLILEVVIVEVVLLIVIEVKAAMIPELLEVGFHLVMMRSLRGYRLIEVDSVTTGPIIQEMVVDLIQVKV